MLKYTLLFVIPLVSAAASNNNFGLKGDELKHREQMVEISRQLGVTCIHCHNTSDFKSDKMPTWQTAKKHMEVVEALNRDFKAQLGVKKVDCFMCHRGKHMPDYKEKVRITD